MADRKFAASTATASRLRDYSFICFLLSHCTPRSLHSFPTRRSSDLFARCRARKRVQGRSRAGRQHGARSGQGRSEEHTSELQSRLHLVCRLLLEKKNLSNVMLLTQLTLTRTCPLYRSPDLALLIIDF